MSGSAKKIMDLIGEDYACSTGYKELGSSQSKDDLAQRIKKTVPRLTATERQGLVLLGLGDLSYFYTQKVAETQKQLKEMGITKKESVSSSNQITFSYQFKSDPDIQQFFKAPWKQFSSDPNEKLRSIEVAESDEFMELKVNIKMK